MRRSFLSPKAQPMGRGNKYRYLKKLAPCMQVPEAGEVPQDRGREKKSERSLSATTTALGSTSGTADQTQPHDKRPPLLHFPGRRHASCCLLPFHKMHKPTKPGCDPRPRAPHPCFRFRSAKNKRTNKPGCVPVSSTIVAAPLTVCAASLRAVARGRPIRTPPSARASISTKMYAGPLPLTPVTAAPCPMSSLLLLSCRGGLGYIVAWDKRGRERRSARAQRRDGGGVVVR